MHLVDRGKTVTATILMDYELEKTDMSGISEEAGLCFQTLKQVPTGTPISGLCSARSSVSCVIGTENNFFNHRNKCCKWWLAS